MKRFLLTLLIVALVAALAALVLAPVAIRQYRLSENAKVVNGYRNAVNRLSAEDCDAMLAQAQEYNRSLGNAAWTDPYAPGSGESAPAGDSEARAALLNPSGNGVMAVLEVPKLGMSLAVYHGDEADASAARVTHVAGSRLPSEGAEGPCLLRATRDRFFNPFAGLDRLIIGDCFFLRVMQQTQTYEVFQVTRATPEALEAFHSTEGDEECALVAEANGMRLVVRGRRVSRQSVNPADDSRPLPSGVPELILAAPVAAVGLILLSIIEWVRRMARRGMRRRMKL